MYHTSYGADFFGKKTDLKKNKEEIMKHVKILRSSNIVLGYLGNHYKSK